YWGLSQVPVARMERSGMWDRPRRLHHRSRISLPLHPGYGLLRRLLLGSLPSACTRGALARGAWESAQAVLVTSCLGAGLVPRDLPRRWRRAKLMSQSRNIRRARRKTMARQSLNRRHFMGLSGAGIAGLVCPHSSALAQINLAQEPDLVVLNAKVYTVDPLEPRVEAFAVKRGGVAAMGKTEDVRSLAGRRTQVFDARQMTVVPGCIDAHNHAPGAILLYDVIVGNPYQVEFVTIASIVDKLKERARTTPPGFWVEGF